MTTVTTFASGSSGNTLLFSWEGGRFLLDAGISCRRIQDALSTMGLRTEDLDGILITHTHSDHIYGMQTLIKRTDCPILASERTCRELDYRLAGVRSRLFPLPLCERSNWNGCGVTAVPTSHDAPGSCAFRLDTAEGGFAFLTDTGIVTDEAREIFPGAVFALLEANHDIETLRAGPYPYALKRRILGPYGHLCNEDAGAFAVELAEAGARRIVLAHLSRENNTPVMAEEAVRCALDGAGLSPSLGIALRDGVFAAFDGEAQGTEETREAVLCGG